MGNKIITENDFFECSGGMMPSPFQARQPIVKKQNTAKYITKDDISTISWVDFGCKKVMLLYAVVAALAALVAALCVATGGAALIAICAVAGLAGAALGAVIGRLICGQLVAPARKWLASKSNFQIYNVHTITGDHYMICNAFVMLGMSSEMIKFNPNIKSWSQAIAKGAAEFLGKLFEGMMAGALIGTAGAALSGLAGAGASGGWAGVGRASLQFIKSMPKNFAVNAIESVGKFGLAMRGVMGVQNTAATYGETGEAGVGDFAKGVVGMEIGAYESVVNIYNGKGTWQDIGGIVLMFSPVGKGKRDIEDGLTKKADDLDSQKKPDDEITAKKQAEAETKSKADEGDAYENGRTKTAEQLRQEQLIADVENGTTPLEGYGEKKGNHRRKGNYGEMKTDVHMEGISEINGKSAELHRISGDRVIDIDQQIKHGIDGVYENATPPPKYVIVESKYGSSDLNPNTKDGPQMSDTWTENRLEDAVGKDKADDITNTGYDRVLSNVDTNGNVTTSKIDANGNVVGPWP